MAIRKGRPLNFKISSYLKTILGKDLITDDYVAIFELVKNSFDAKAKKVKICFEDDEIYIVDNGKGMSRKDILNKWVFVAYSAKREGGEDKNSDYREKISPVTRYAGSKGVGRFSCDRLGAALLLQTKSAEASKVEIIDVEWNDFEESSVKEFATVPIYERTSSIFELPSWVTPPKKSGTVLVIKKLRAVWDREKILELKQALSKLINPFGAKKNDFSIEIVAPSERDTDNTVKLYTASDEDLNSRVVNGPVENFIFETLEKKTTWIKTWIDEKQKKIYSELTDRGKVIYRISEPLKFYMLVDSQYEAHLYYLNRSAKVTFTRKMGVSPLSFGSVFLFKNGFRVYPIGREGDDSFMIDRRKQQGYSRYLGTRDILGRIDISGDESNFRESSSRDKGLIETVAYNQLLECFKTKTLIRLENYVVGVNWRLKYDQDLDDPSFLSGDEARAKVIDVITKLCSGEEIKVEFYAKDLFSVISNKIEGFDKTIKNLEVFAEKLGNKDLADKARDAAVKYEEMQKAEAEAITFAEREREARIKAEASAQTALKNLAKKSKELDLEKEKNLFFSSQQSRDKDVLENLHHQIIIYASNAINHIEANLLELSHGAVPTTEELKDQFSSILLIMQRVVAASRFATSANFKMDASQITENLPSFIKQYVERICPLFEGRTALRVVDKTKGFVKKFKPIEISIIIDNLIDNSRKATASHIEIIIESLESNAIKITFTDDGSGLDARLPDEDVIFEKGVTTTGGSGIGLYHVRQILEGMNGDIRTNKDYKNGMQFIVRIYK